MTRQLSIALTALLVLSACGDAGPTPEGAPEQPIAAPIQVTAADRAAATTKFTTLCYTCHGKTGSGDGPASAGLVPPPRNFQDPEWQESVTDEHIEKIIVSGGIAVGKAITMPGNPDLRGKPGVVTALREHIRGLAKSN